MLARLERIETLDRQRAQPGDLLAELRALLTEAEAWARAERTVPERRPMPWIGAGRCSAAGKHGRNSSRTLLA